MKRQKFALKRIFNTHHSHANLYNVQRISLIDNVSQAE